MAVGLSFGAGDRKLLDRDHPHLSEQLWEVSRMRSEEGSGLSERHQVRLGVTSNDLF